MMHERGYCSYLLNKIRFTITLKSLLSSSWVILALRYVTFHYIIHNQWTDSRYPARFTYRNEYMTGTLVYIKKDYSQNIFKNGWKMRYLWPSEIRRNWTLDMIYWAFRRNQNHSNWNLANILAWKTSLIIGLCCFIHLWKFFCLKLALNLSDPQTPHIKTIYENFLQTILFYVKKGACYILATICEPCRIPNRQTDFIVEIFI